MKWPTFIYNFTFQLLKIVQDRPVIQIPDLEQYQITDYNALVTTNSANKIIPNMNSNKSKVVSDYLAHISPDAFTASKPQNIAYVLVEGENVIATSPGTKKTVKEHCEFLFIHKLKPLLRNCQEMMIMFDDQHKPLNIKSTDDIRYGGHLEVLDLTKEHVIDDWNTIFKNPHNKRQFKTIFVDHVMQICGSHMHNNQCIYFNGTYDEGKVWRAKQLESGYTKLEVMEHLTLSCGESDIKIFQLSQKLDLKGQSMLILSMDTDVKMLALYWSSKLQIDYVIRSGSNLIPSYFSPKIMIDSLNQKFGDNVGKFVENLLKIYAIFGCDYLPCFAQISHSYAMKVYEKVYTERPFDCLNDFLWLILRVYMQKNHALKKLFPDTNDDLSLDEMILKTRGAIKSVRGSDILTIPLPSVLRLHLKRADLVQQFWTGSTENMDPSLYGYCRY